MQKPLHFSFLVCLSVEFFTNKKTEGVSNFVNQLDTFPIILMCGSQNSGKSSMCRYILNYLLNKYVYIIKMRCNLFLDMSELRIWRQMLGKPSFRLAVLSL